MEFTIFFTALALFMTFKLYFDKVEIFKSFIKGLNDMPRSKLMVNLDKDIETDNEIRVSNKTLYLLPLVGIIYYIRITHYFKFGIKSSEAGSTHMLMVLMMGSLSESYPDTYITLDRINDFYKSDRVNIENFFRVTE